MFENLIGYMRDESPLMLDLEGSPNERDLQIAVLAILADISQVDQEFAGSELHRICTLMFEEFGLIENQSAEMLEIVEFLRNDADKLQNLTQKLNQHFDLSQRERVLALAWRLIMADGEASLAESTYAAELRKKLGLSLEQALRARALAERAQSLAEIMHD